MAAERARNSFNIADLMESLTVSKKEADKMEVEIKDVIRDVSRPNTIQSLSRLISEINREIEKLNSKMRKLVDTLERDERRMKRANANERLQIQRNKLQLQSSIRDVRKLLDDYHEKLDTVSESLDKMKKSAAKEAKKHRDAMKNMTPKEKTAYKKYIRELAEITGDFSSLAFFNSNSDSNSNGARSSKSRSKSRSPRHGGATRRRNNRSTRRK